MKKTRKMRPECTYLFKSAACSNTVYYEQLVDAQQFLILAQQHLKDFMNIHEYMLCKDGWVFVARLKTEEQIVSAFAKRRKKYNKLPKQLPVWKIVSEQIRLFLSAYVTKYNRRTDREGVLVRRPYERYYFDTVREAMRMIRRIRRRVVGLQQGKKMYRAKKGHYKIPKKLGKGGVFLSSKRRGRKGDFLLDLSVFQRFKNKVLPKKLKSFIKQTKKAHQIPIPDF